MSREKTIANMGYVLLDEQLDKNGKLKVIIQDKYGYKYFPHYWNIVRGYKPKLVYTGNPFVLENISLWLKLNKKSFCLLENKTYTGSEKIGFKCLKETCEETFFMDWEDVKRGRECPHCAGTILGKRNNLEYTRPDLAKEWDYDKNIKSPNQYHQFSHEKVWWKCLIEGHSWLAKIQNRSNGRGCPKCLIKSHGEKKIEKFLLSNSIGHIPQFTFEKCRDKYVLPFDFYVLDYNICIEYHGEQHYKPVRFGGVSKKQAESNFKESQRRDKIKEKYCKDNNIPLLIIPYWKFNNMEQILTEALSL